MDRFGLFKVLIAAGLLWSLLCGPAAAGRAGPAGAGVAVTQTVRLSRQAD